MSISPCLLFSNRCKCEKMDSPKLLNSSFKLVLYITYVSSIHLNMLLCHLKKIDLSLKIDVCVAVKKLTLSDQIQDVAQTFQITFNIINVRIIQ